MDFHQTICALMLRKSGFGLLIGKFCQFLTQLSACDTSVFSLWITYMQVNVNGFSWNLVCALILWGFVLGLHICKFCHLFTELSAHNTSVFSFPDDNLSEDQWIFTKLAMCIDIVEIWFGIGDRLIQSICELSAHDMIMGSILVCWLQLVAKCFNAMVSYM